MAVQGIGLGAVWGEDYIRLLVYFLAACCEPIVTLKTYSSAQAWPWQHLGPVEEEHPWASSSLQSGGWPSHTSAGGVSPHLHWCVDLSGYLSCEVMTEEFKGERWPCSNERKGKVRAWWVA